MQIQLERERRPLNGSILTAKRPSYITESETQGARCQLSPVILSAWHPVPCRQESRLEGSGLPAMESFTTACEQKHYVILEVGYFPKMCNYCIRKGFDGRYSVDRKCNLRAGTSTRRFTRGTDRKMGQIWVSSLSEQSNTRATQRTISSLK